MAGDLVISPSGRSSSFTSSARAARSLSLGLVRIWRILFPVVLVLGCLYLLAPTFVAVLASVSETAYLTFPPQGLSLKWYQSFFGREDFVASLILSLGLAAGVAFVSVLLAVGLAVAIGRRSGIGRTSLTSLSYLPLILPTIVYGPALLLWAAKIHLTASYGAVLFTLAAAHLILALPFALQSILVSYDTLDPALAEAAMICGARPRRVFRHITLPLLMPGIIAGGTFAFLTSFDEPIVALFLSRSDLVTLPVQIYTYLRFKPDPTIAAIATVMIVLSLVAVLIADRLVGLGKMMGLDR
ncbi:MAG: ABC transporter permease [Thermomicrobiales bacterium]|nr:ABC transporter permease [Thermomicrobiales bacterium]